MDHVLITESWARQKLALARSRFVISVAAFLALTSVCLLIDLVSGEGTWWCVLPARSRAPRP